MAKPLHCMTLEEARKILSQPQFYLPAIVKLAQSRVAKENE